MWLAKRKKKKKKKERKKERKRSILWMCTNASSVKKKRRQRFHYALSCQLKRTLSTDQHCLHLTFFMGLPTHWRSSSEKGFSFHLAMFSHFRSPETLYRTHLADPWLFVLSALFLIFISALITSCYLLYRMQSIFFGLLTGGCAAWLWTRYVSLSLSLSPPSLSSSSSSLKIFFL